MTGSSFVLRGLRYFRGSYLGVLAGSALGSMVLLGAMMAGDSVKATLRGLVGERLGKIEAVLSGGDRMFRSALADEMAAEGVMAAPVLVLRGTATAQASGRATGEVQVLGVDGRFWEFAPGGGGRGAPSGRDWFINGHLADQLGLKTGESLVLRFDKPGLGPRDAPLAGEAEELVVMRGTVTEVLGGEEFGSFSLESTQLPRATVFVPIASLQEMLERDGRANLLLVGEGDGEEGGGEEGGGGECDGHRPTLQLTDYGITIVEVPLAGAWEVATERVFFDRRLTGQIMKALPGAQPVTTYLAVTIAANGKETPYSMVTAVDREAAPFVPVDFEGAVVNEWLAADLGAEVGDEVRIDYFAVAEGNRLVKRSATLPVAAVVPLEGLAADPRWMPEFPGVAAAEDAADWKPGIPIDLDRIRDKDEEYWDDFRGTPKLYLPLETGRELFGNRWGEFTAFRVTDEDMAGIERRLLEAVTPADAGLVWRNLRVEAEAAAESPVDFAGLFLSMSFYLMAAAVALTAMLFRFHVEQRNRESGLLAAVGIPAGKVLRWRLAEGFCVVVVGSVIGALAACAYTRGLLWSLDAIWDSGPRFRFDARPGTVIGGTAGFVVVMMAVIWMATRRQARVSASLRMEAGTEEVMRGGGSRWPWWAVGFAAAGAGALAMAGSLGPQGAFFLGGFAFLMAGLAGFRWKLRRAAVGGLGELTSKRLAALNLARRPSRSLVVVGSLACGVFLVVSVASFRKGADSEWRERQSGSGGFAYWIETTRPVQREAGGGGDVLQLGPEGGRFDPVLPLRIGAGDDADCFNLNSVSRPRLLAADVKNLAELGAFPIKDVVDGGKHDWGLLEGGEVMRAFVDEATLLWALKKKLGDRLTYLDEWGDEFEVELAGSLGGTVLQGGLVVDEARFLERFPSAEGYRLFLAGCDGDLEEGRGFLQRRLADHGATVATTVERLAAFHAVENSYIAIFHVLGGLGVVLGSAGLGLTTARNLAERRDEFAVLKTVGVPREVSAGVVFAEVLRLVGWGLGIGVAAALVAVLPNVPAGGIVKALGWTLALAGVMAINGWFWAWVGWRRFGGGA